MRGFVTAALMFAVTLPLYTNCTRGGGPAVSFSKTQDQLSGNGDTYGGKPIYIDRDPENECRDGSFVRGKIVRDEAPAGDSASYLLLRHNCLSINPPRVVTVREVGPGPLQVVYDRRVFERDTGVPLSASYRLFCTSETGVTQELPSDALSGGTSALPAPTGESVWLVRGCDVGGMCEVRNNCFFDSATVTPTFTNNPDCLSAAPAYAALSGATANLGRGRLLASCRVQAR